MRIPRRSIFKGLAASLGLVAVGKVSGESAPEAGTAKPHVAGHGFGPDPLYEKPLPIKVAEIDAHALPGVSASEVSDYDVCGYKGELKPSPPHADMNPNDAIIISWQGNPNAGASGQKPGINPRRNCPTGPSPCTPS